MLKDYYKGMPCTLQDELLGRIIGEHEDASWKQINGKKMYSLPLFSTPHGTVIKTGLFRLFDINEDQMKKLVELEKSVLDKENLYGGYLKETTLKST